MINYLRPSRPRISCEDATIAFSSASSALIECEYEVRRLYLTKQSTAEWSPRVTPALADFDKAKTAVAIACGSSKEAMIDELRVLLAKTMPKEGDLQQLGRLQTQAYSLRDRILNSP
ncbi:MAG: hypothetical protein JSR82_10050 [Verrucomicrobia bacterium]|nr:hypothetical protein [Verrucomicrobiota bacterium]